MWTISVSVVMLQQVSVITAGPYTVKLKKLAYKILNWMFHIYQMRSTSPPPPPKKKQRYAS